MGEQGASFTPNAVLPLPLSANAPLMHQVGGEKNQSHPVGASNPFQAAHRTSGPRHMYGAIHLTPLLVCILKLPSKSHPRLHQGLALRERVVKKATTVPRFRNLSFDHLFFSPRLSMPMRACVCVRVCGCSDLQVLARRAMLARRARREDGEEGGGRKMSVSVERVSQFQLMIVIVGSRPPPMKSLGKSRWQARFKLILIELIY